MLYLAPVFLFAQISQANFELMKHRQENTKLLSKVVQSPQKLQVETFLFY
jgi:hypothetical protein